MVSIVTAMQTIKSNFRNIVEYNLKILIFQSETFESIFKLGIKDALYTEVLKNFM